MNPAESRLELNICINQRLTLSEELMRDSCNLILLLCLNPSLSTNSRSAWDKLSSNIVGWHREWSLKGCLVQWLDEKVQHVQQNVLWRQQQIVSKLKQFLLSTNRNGVCYYQFWVSLLPVFSCRFALDR